MKRSLHILNNERFAAGVRDIWDGIRAQPARASLSMLAISIGIAAMTLLLAFLGGLKHKSDMMVSELGANVVAIIAGENQIGNKAPTLGPRHIAYLKANMKDCELTSVKKYVVPLPGGTDSLTVIATDASFLNVRQWKMADGSFFDSTTIQERQRQAVISSDLGRKWKWKPGDIIMIHHTACSVAGVVEPGGNISDTDFGNDGIISRRSIVLVPNTISPDWITDINTRESGIDGIFIRVPEEHDFRRSIELAKRLMSHPDYRLNNISWTTPGSLIAGINKIQKVIKLTAGTIAFLCILLGSVTLASLMTVNVRQRTSEIGLRRALGASRADIAFIYVAESCLITFAAVITGVATACLLLAIAQARIPVPAKTDIYTCLIPFAVALLSGAASSYVPAKLAAETSPSEALRSE